MKKFNIMIRILKKCTLITLFFFMASNHAYAYKKALNTTTSGVIANSEDWKFFTQLRVITGFDKKGNAKEEAWCGGSYIGKGYVLTAAHCVEGASAHDISVRIGAHTQNGEDGVKADVSKIYIHPFYDEFDNDIAVNDIALLKLDTIPQNVQAVKLATKPINNYVNGNDTLYAAGFSNMEENKGKQPNNLRSVRVPYVSKSQCDDEYRDIGNGQFCAGYNSAEKTLCLFDDGGPIVSRQNGEVTQLGVINWGGECNSVQKYGIYADVSTSGPFIDAIMNIKSQLTANF